MSYSESTQTERLLTAVASGDRSVLDELFRLYEPYVKRLVQLRISPELSSRVDASDVVQETHMVVMRRIDEFLTKSPASFRVWLRSRAIEQLADHHRRHVSAKMRSVRNERRLRDTSSLAVARMLLTDTPSKVLQKDEIARRLRNLIENLNEVDREILTLRHAEGLTNAETAEALAIEPSTARKRYGRALRRLVEKVTAAGLNEDISLEA